MKENLIYNKRKKLIISSMLAWIILLSSGIQAATYYAISNGNWNNNNTWSLTSGGPAVLSGWPGSGDIVYISEGANSFDITVPSGFSAVCSSIMMGSANVTAATLILADASASLEVNGDMIVNGPLGVATREIRVNGGTLVVNGNLEMGTGQAGAQGNRICLLSITTGEVTVYGNLVFNNIINSAPNQTWINMTGGAGTINLAGAFIINNNIGRLDAGTTSTFNFNGYLAAQVIPIGISNVVFNNINLNNTYVDGATPGAAIDATNVTGNISVQSGTFDNGGHTIVLAPARNFNVADNALFKLGGTSTMVNVSGGGTKNFGLFSCVNYSGSSQVVSADTYGKLVFSGSGTKTFGTGSTIIEGTLSMEGTAIAAMDGSLSFGPGAALQYKGSSAQLTGIEFPGNFDGTGGVIIDNPNGVTLDAGRTIASKLTLTNGLLHTASYVLTISFNWPSAVIGASPSSYINGQLERGIASGENSYLFPIGTGTHYTPVTVDFLSGTESGSLLAYTTDGDHPDILNSFFNSTRSVNRYWTLNAITGLANVNYNATFNWSGSDEDLNFNFLTAACGVFNGISWDYPDMGSLSANSAQVTNVNDFSDFQVANTCDSYPTAEISGDITVCSGDEVVLTVDLGGTAPWDFQWYDGESIYSVSGVQESPYLIYMYPTKNTTYTLVEVTDGVGCIGTGTGRATVKIGPKAIAPEVTAVPGIVSIPIIVKDFLEVGAISLTLNYDKDVVQFDSFVNNSGLIDYFHCDESGANGVIRFSGITLTSWNLIDDGILLTINFNYSDGYTVLEWDDSEATMCEFAGPPPEFLPYCDTPVETYYINGSVGPTPLPPAPSADVYWTGNTSTDWYDPTNWVDEVVPVMTDNVVIEGTPLHFPLYTGNFTIGQACYNLILSDQTMMDVTANFRILPGHNLDMGLSDGLLRVGGHWQNDGTFIAGNGSVEFYSSDPSDLAPALSPVNSILDYDYETFTGVMIPLTGTTPGPSGDNEHLDIDLGFSFFYNGHNYSLARINTNGWMSLDRTGDDYDSFLNESLFQNGSPSCVLAPWWDNLLADGISSISYKSENGVFTVEWKNILAFSSNSTMRLTFQLKLYEQTGTIEFIYGNITGGIPCPNESASIGIKNESGGMDQFREGTTGTSNTIITDLRCSSNWPTENIRFKLPTASSPELFWRVNVSKTGNANLNIQRDVIIQGIE